MRMTTEWTSEGFAIVARPYGAGRFFSAAFLLVWLAGWAVGESVALGVLGWGSWALLTGHPPRPGDPPLVPGPALAIGAFLVVWTFFWTIGGMAALGETLRLLWSEDRLVARPSGLLLTRRRGPIGWRKELPREGVRRIYRVARSGAVRVETVKRTIDFASLRGSDVGQALRTLRSQVGLAESDEQANLPAGWGETITPEGQRALVCDNSRKARARIAILMSVGAVAIASLLVAQAAGAPELVPAALITSLLAAGLIAGTVWLAWGRIEHAFSEGRIVVRRRFGDRVDDLFEGRRLALSVHSDSDGDDWYTLEVLGPKPGGEGVARRKITTALHDPSEPRAIGRWLAAHTGITFEDATERGLT